MSSNKMLEKINDAVEEAIRPIIAKGANMNAAELEVLTKAVCTIEKIKQIENDDNGYSEYSRGYNEPMGNSYRRGRSMTTGRYVSRDALPYSEGSSSRRFYDADQSRNAGYSGHSIKDRMVAQLEQMFDYAQSDHERQTIETWLRRIQSE